LNLNKFNNYKVIFLELIGQVGLPKVRRRLEINDANQVVLAD